jgi:glycosidase
LKQRNIGLILDFIPNHVALDHPWAKTNPERFVLHDGKPVCGKDPFFPPWTDTLQLDYRRPETRDAMIGMLKGIAARCDGVRCDMAMLVLNDVFEKTWGPPTPPAASGTPEFWTAAIGAVRREHPRFMFIAEAYWGLERRLQSLGFDYTYDKTLYDHLAHRKPYDVPLHIHGAGPDYIRRGVHFLENHDEPRAAATFALPEHRAAAVATFSLPGLRFIHEGEMEGARRFSRIQLARRPVEPTDRDVLTFYEKLLDALGRSTIGQGRGEVLRPDPAWDGNPTHGCIVAVQWQSESGSFDLAVANLAPHRAQGRIRVTATGVDGGRFQMRDRIGEERYERSGNEMLSPGLYLDLAEHAAHLYRFERNGAI